MDTQNNNSSNVNNEQSSSGGEVKQKNTLMALLSYIGPLVIVSYLSAKDDPFVKFHIKQGLVLAVVEIALWMIGSMMWGLWMILQFVHLALLVLSILGIINVLKGEEKKLPVVGDWADKFNF